MYCVLCYSVLSGSSGSEVALVPPHLTYKSLPPLDTYLQGSSLLDSPPLSPPQTPARYSSSDDLRDHDDDDDDEEEGVSEERSTQGEEECEEEDGSKLASPGENTGTTRQRIAAALRPARRHRLLSGGDNERTTSDAGTITGTSIKSCTISC